MTEGTHKKSFWGSLPGVLTGIAAVITAITGLYLAGGFGSVNNNGGQEEANQLPPPPSIPQPTPPTEWQLIAEETFSSDTGSWPTGIIGSDENMRRFERQIFSGKYRWDLEFTRGRERYQQAPYAPTTDFYFAADVRIVESEGSISVSLLFGRASKQDYGFRVSSNGKFALSRFDGTENKLIIDWTPVTVDWGKVNRLAVVVQSNRMRLFLNSELVGEFNDPGFTGGKVGISVTGYDPGTFTVVDFDNIEYRRKP